jgi:tRNA-splicing ligase RtcB (3'-phosphate/5'-hydroxy nucleic acid ligase)
MSQVADYGLDDVVVCIDPYGCIMAGDLPPFWQKGKRTRR